MALQCLTHCTTELQSREREGSPVAKSRELSWGCTSKGTLPSASGLIHTRVLGSASAGPGGWHSPGPKPGHMWVWWGQRGAPLQGKTSAQHRPELCPLVKQCVIWGCFRHLGGFWTVELCYLLPGLFDFHSPHGGQSADTMMEIEVVDSAASVWRGKVSSAQTSQCCPISHPPDLWIFPSFK